MICHELNKNFTRSNWNCIQTLQIINGNEFTVSEYLIKNRVVTFLFYYLSHYFSKNILKCDIITSKYFFHMKPVKLVMTSQLTQLFIITFDRFMPQRRLSRHIMLNKKHFCFRTNTITQTMEYAGFPFPEGSSSYLTGSCVYKYLMSFVKHFDLMENIQVCSLRSTKINTYIILVFGIERFLLFNSTIDQIWG